MASKKLEAALAACKHIRPGTECQDARGRRRRIVTAAVDARTHKVLVVYTVPATGQTLVVADAAWAKAYEFDADVPVGPDTAAWKNRPKPGGHYGHAGGTCRVVTAALYQRTGRPYVIYKCDETKTAWAVPIGDWLGRFTSIR